MNNENPNTNTNSAQQVNNTSTNVNANVTQQPSNASTPVNNATATTGAVSQPASTPDVSNTVRIDPLTGNEIPVGQDSSPASAGATPTIQAQPQSAPVQDANNKPSSEYKPPSKFKTFLIVTFFVLVLLFIIFLPEVHDFVAEYFSGGPQKAENITTGKLVCTLETNTVNLDKNIERVFNYTDNKLQSAKFTTTTKGDVTEDEATLDELNNQCKLVKSNVSGLSGISVECNYSDGKLVVSEHFNYESYNVDEVKAAYTEAGGDIIEYEYGYDIDKIMLSMRQAGFTCNKEK